MRRPSSRLYLVFLATLLAAPVLVRASADDAPPATQPVESIRRWISELADAEPQTRAKARRALLHLSVDDLPTLRSLVGAGAANLPAQREALYDIVVHLYLTGDRPRAIPGQSFMGVELPVVPSDEPGLVFRNRLIGFPAYAAIEPGDIVLQIDEAPSLDLNDREQLAAFRRSTPAGLVIHLRVLREGQVSSIPLPLSSAPDWGEERIESVTDRRLERAHAYWEKNFQPVFASGTS